MMEGMSVDPLPSGLLQQLGSGFLFGLGERSGQLPPLPSGLFGAKASTGHKEQQQGVDANAHALQMPKAMSLELLPSSLLQSYSGLLQDLDAAAAAGDQQRGDTDRQGTPAAAAAAAAGIGVGAGAAGKGGVGVHLQRGGVDVSMDVGPAIDEIMAAAELQQT
jgi:hypothetical protein